MSEVANPNSSGVISGWKDLVKEYPAVQTMTVGAAMAFAAALAARKAKKRGYNVSPLLAGAVGAALPLGWEFATNSGLGKNLNRWGWKGFAPTSSLQNTPNRQGYVDRYRRSLIGGANEPIAGDPYMSELPQRSLREFNALDPQTQKYVGTTLGVLDKVSQ